MRKLILLVIVGVLGWQGYRHYEVRVHQPAPQASPPQRGSAPVAQSKVSTAATAIYRCDGRVYCSQMTSCEEATYFLRNCPNVKMDGNNDGVPCEQQWCRR